jgi:hypothetical protein
VADNDLPAEVKQLIADHIVSVEQLEILLLIAARPDAEWSARGVSEEVRTSERSAAARLADLHDHGLLVARDAGGEQHYRYGPASEWKRRAIALLAIAYAERRYTIIDFIFSKPIENLRVYADAFRFRKGGSHG